MRSLAGMRVQEALRGLPGIRRYADEIAAAIGAALLLMPEPRPETRLGHGGRALILFAAEHGFVGGFNERLAEAAQAISQTLPQALPETPELLFVLGSHGGSHLLERGARITWTRPMATRLASAPETIRHLTDELYQRIAGGEISQVEVMFGRYRQGNTPKIERRLLLPFDPRPLATKPPRQAPLHNLPPQALLEKLTAEYVYALLTEAAVESIASENAARFTAMESAHDNVSTKLDQLRQAARQARQDEITAELLDLIVGAEALSKS
jgi:F-type H+-transporting ATPase subunit gamma